MPALPGAQRSSAERGLRRRAQASACSRPPLPTSRTFMGAPFRPERRDYSTRRSRGSTGRVVGERRGSSEPRRRSFLALGSRTGFSSCRLCCRRRFFRHRLRVALGVPAAALELERGAGDQLLQLARALRHLRSGRSLIFCMHLDRSARTSCSGIRRSAFASSLTGPSIGLAIAGVRLSSARLGSKPRPERRPRRRASRRP